MNLCIVHRNRTRAFCSFNVHMCCICSICIYLIFALCLFMYLFNVLYKYVTLERLPSLMLIYFYSYSRIISCFVICFISLLEAGTEVICGKFGASIVFHKRGPSHAMVRVRYDFLLNISVKCLTALVSLGFG